MRISGKIASSAVVVVLLTVLLAGLLIYWRSHLVSPQGARTLIVQGRRLAAGQQWEPAQDAFQRAQQLDPQSGEAVFLLAELASRRGQQQTALELIEEIPQASTEWRVQGWQLAADIYREELHRADAAEDAYREALRLQPANAACLTGLVRLLATCGRRREAVPYLLALVKQGVASDLLVLLAREEGAIDDREWLEKVHQSSPGDINARLGLAWQKSDAGDVDGALDLLQGAVPPRDAVSEKGRRDALKILTLQILSHHDRWDRLREVLSAPHLPADSAIVWLARARLAEIDQLPDGALRCYWEACKRTPESRLICFRLSRLLQDRGLTADAEPLVRHLESLQSLQSQQDRTLFSNSGDPSSDLRALAECYAQLGRMWEALGWYQLLVHDDPQNTAARQKLAALQKQSSTWPLEQTLPTSNPARRLDLSTLAVPVFQSRATPGSTSPSMATDHWRFDAEAAARGLNFQYVNGTTSRPERRMFEFTGGGIGVLDFDLDGYSDVFCTQGGQWPASPSSGAQDQLFRNEQGQHFTRCDADARLSDAHFGQGVAIGDFDADGFPDVYVANIGQNRLWRNNGDGTFQDVTVEAGIATSTWTTSCAMADLNGDQLPDLYDVNYVQGDDVFDRVCQHQDGSPKICMPFDFDAQPDQLWVNGGAGDFRDATQEILVPAPEGKGLGIAIWDATGTGEPSILVANDTTPDFFYQPELSDSGSVRLRDQAVTAGLAFNYDGKATASMGIGLGDVDGDGRMDVHITNFSSESNSLFLNDAPGLYSDHARDWGIARQSFDWLGFGTQFLDVDLDGRLELFVANGHIDDWRAQGKPWQMPAVLFRRDGTTFQPVAPEMLGPYFEARWLGRAVARIDWNRDGKEDLLVGHLGTPLELLTNHSAPVGNVATFRLVGIQGNRDAVGATLRVRVGDRILTRQVTAGDGYQCSNERQISVGLGTESAITELTISWPGGRQQSVTDRIGPGHYLCREGKSPLVLP